MKNGNHSTIAEDRTRRLQAASMRYEEQEFSSFKHCMKVNQKKSAWNACPNEVKSPENSVFCDETYIARKHQSANVTISQTVA